MSYGKDFFDDENFLEYCEEHFKKTLGLNFSVILLRELIYRFKLKIKKEEK